jgi:hypothetical protein
VPGAPYGAPAYGAMAPGGFAGAQPPLPFGPPDGNPYPHLKGMVNGHPLVVVPRPVPFARPAPSPCTTCMAPPPPSPCNACGTATTTTSFGMGGLDPFAATSTFGTPFGSTPSFGAPFGSTPTTTFGAPFGSTPTTTTFGAPFGATPFPTSYNAAPFTPAF